MDQEVSYGILDYIRLIIDVNSCLMVELQRIHPNEVADGRKMLTNDSYE